MVNSWISALKKWNSQQPSGNWCVPKKGTKDYEEVRKFMGEPTKMNDAKEPISKKLAAKSQMKKPKGAVKEKKEKISKSDLKKLEMEAIAEARKLGGSINRAFSPSEVAKGKAELKELMKKENKKQNKTQKSQPAPAVAVEEKINVIVPRKKNK